MKTNPTTVNAPMLASPYEWRAAPGPQASESEIRTALDSGEWGLVHSFTTGSTVDGPGVRVVAWLAGCQFRCVYCHNPDTWKMSNGIPVPLVRATEQIRKYRHGLGTMRGGLTISGGEPLMQQRFVLKVFRAAQEMGVHTALDTNGYLGDRLGDEDLKAADLVLLDLKAFSGDLHRRLTGLDNQPVLEFARRLAARQRPVWIRFVLVPGWTDDRAEIERLAAFVASLGNVQRVDVLPFHQMGRFKWEKLEMDYALRNATLPSRADIAQAISQFRSAGLKAD